MAAVLYINGLGDGSMGSREEFLIRHWTKSDVIFVPACVNWYDGKEMASKLRSAEKKLVTLLEQHNKVILLGSSAGGSLALQLYTKHRGKKLYMVNAHGRLMRGVQRWPDYRTLEWAAHLAGQGPKSQAFYDSVVTCESTALPGLKPADLQHILVLKPLLDFVVPTRTMSAPGAKTHRSWALGHKLAGVYDLVVARNRILRFAGVADEPEKVLV